MTKQWYAESRDMFGRMQPMVLHEDAKPSDKWDFNSAPRNVYNVRRLPAHLQGNSLNALSPIMSPSDQSIATAPQPSVHLKVKESEPAAGLYMIAAE
jgi:hypothetical protein